MKSLDVGRLAVVRKIEEHAIAWQVIEKLAELPCKKLFLLDTCYSGAASKGASRSLDGRQAFVMASASADEESYEPAALQHGIFTYCLLEGLKGFADGTKSSSGTGSVDENVNIFELADYVKEHTPTHAKDHVAQRQNPVILPGSYDPVFEFPLVRVQSTKTTSVSP